jgi:hypothetical protein
MKGKIQSIYPKGITTVYLYSCQGEDGLFRFPVDHRCHFGILEAEGYPIGRTVEYDDESDPPAVRFLD